MSFNVFTRLITYIYMATYLNIYIKQEYCRNDKTKLYLQAIHDIKDKRLLLTDFVQLCSLSSLPTHVIVLLPPSPCEND